MRVGSGVMDPFWEGRRLARSTGWSDARIETQTLNLKSKGETKRWAPDDERRASREERGAVSTRHSILEGRTTVGIGGGRSTTVVNRWWSRRLNDASRSAGPVRGCLAVVEGWQVCRGDDGTRG